MIANGEKLYYLAVKSFSALFRGITSKQNKVFYCLECFHSFRTENKLKKAGKCIQKSWLLLSRNA